MDASTVLRPDFEQLLETLELVKRMIEEPVAPQRRQRWGQEHCRRHGMRECRLWGAFAQYRAGGPAAVLRQQPEDPGWARRSRAVHEAILTGLRSAPREVLGPFCQLLDFHHLLTVRLQLLCDQMLERLVDPEEPPQGLEAASEAQGSLQRLVEILGQEVEVLHRIVYAGTPLSMMLRDYEHCTLPTVGLEYWEGEE